VPDATEPREHWLLRIDRRIIFLVVLVALSAPLVALRFTSKLTMKPAPLPSARKLFDRIEQIAREREQALKEGKPYNKIVLIGSEVEPQTRGELYPQAEAVIRHLMMRRVPFAILTLTPNGAGYTTAIPEKIARELGRDYGKDWVNFGYTAGDDLLVQQMAKDMPGALKNDYKGTKWDAKDKDGKPVLAAVQGVRDAGDVSLVIEISGLVGTLNWWIDYFASAKARPDMANGCTAISVPEAFAFLESKQIIGLLEGIAGAATYNEFITRSVCRTSPMPRPSPAST